jgi:hypothetical protein
VVFVMILVWIVAVLSILGGLFFMLASEAVLAQAGISKSAAMTYGWWEIGYGVITALVAMGLGRGSRIARLLVSLLMALRIVAAAWAAIALSGHRGFWTAVGAGVIAIVILIMLWNARADAFFKGK